jgi:predicted ATPase
VVRGEAGIGKSALLAAVAARAREQGLVVHRAVVYGPSRRPATAAAASAGNGIRVS